MKFCNSKTNDFFAKGVIIMARPKKVIDMQEVEKLASEGCTVDEIAAYFHVNKSTLYRRKKFKETYERGLEKCKLSVRRALYKKGVINGDTKALIFLAKNLLGMTDNPVQQQDTQEQVIRVILED
jgi:hypothetical protein